jgi:hypothetical protein
MHEMIYMKIFFLTISRFILRENSIKYSIPILHEFSILKKKNII